MRSWQILGALTPRMHALCDDAARQGYKVQRRGDNRLLIGKRSIAAPAVTIYLSPPGGFYTANRADTGDLSVCTAIRTLKTVRLILGLNK